jgi:hypothetical protein
MLLLLWACEHTPCCLASSRHILCSTDNVSLHFVVVVQVSHPPDLSEGFRPIQGLAAYHADADRLDLDSYTSQEIVRDK